MRALHADHIKHAPATRRAMAAALQFSEDIVDVTFHGKGADLVATLKDGRTIGREVSVF